MSFMQTLTAEVYLYPNLIEPYTEIINDLEDLELLGTEGLHAPRPFWNLGLGLGVMHKTWALHEAVLKLYNGNVQHGNRYLLEWEQLAALKDLMRLERENETNDIQRGNLLHAERVLSDTLAMRPELDRMLAEIYYWHEGD